MSEYQYYEFQAVDRPLTETEMAELRSSSTRARITPASFVNDYSWGNFKGDEDAWMEKYFDAFLYLANWGTHILKLRLPARLLDIKTARPYCAGERASVREKNGKVILTFVSEDEQGDDLVEGSGHLSSLIPVRAELGRGDLRALYLGWLLCVQSGDLDDDDLEPPVPAGLAQLSASLKSVVEFLRIDPERWRGRSPPSGRECRSWSPPSTPSATTRRSFFSLTSETSPSAGMGPTSATGSRRCGPNTPGSPRCSSGCTRLACDALPLFHRDRPGGARLLDSRRRGTSANASIKRGDRRERVRADRPGC